MDDTKGMDKAYIIVASVLFVLALTLYFVSDYFAGAFLIAIAVVLISVAITRDVEIYFMGAVVVLLYGCWLINIELLGTVLVSGYSPFDYYGAYGYIDIFLMMPLLFVFLSMSFSINKRPYCGADVYRIILLITKKETFKKASIMISYVVFVMGIALPLIDRLFLAAPIVSLAGLLLIRYFRKPLKSAAIASFLLSTSYILALQINYYLINKNYKVNNDVTKDKWPPLCVHLIPTIIFVFALPIAIMALLSFAQVIGFPRERDGDKSNNVSDGNSEGEA